MKLTGVEVPAETLFKLQPNTVIAVISDDKGEIRTVKVDGSMRSPVETTRCRGVGFTPKVADPQYPATTGGTVRSGHPDQSIGV